jgi:hypothetical protein
MAGAFTRMPPSRLSHSVPTLLARARPLASAGALALLGGCTPRASTVLSLAVAPRTVAPGDTVRLTLTVANPGGDTLRLAFEPGCPVRFAVRHAAEGWRAHPVPDPCATLATGDSARVVVAPHGAWRTEWRWMARGEDPRHPLRPGEYVVEASLAQRTELRGGRRAFQVGQGAPPVVLHVRPVR